MDYAAAAKSSETTEDYLPPLLFVLPITKEDFNTPNGIIDIFVKLCTTLLAKLPCEARTKTVIQRVTYGFKKLKAVKVNLPTSCQNVQNEMLGMGLECGNKTVWPVRDDRTYRFYPCNVSIKIQNALPNLTNEEIKNELKLPEGITANDDLNFKTVSIGPYMKVFDGTATISATVQSAEQMEEMKNWSRKAFFEEKQVRNQVTQMYAPNIMTCTFCEKKGSFYRGHDDTWCTMKTKEERELKKKAKAIEDEGDVFTADEQSVHNEQIAKIRNDSCASTSSRNNKRRRSTPKRANSEKNPRLSARQRTSQIPKMKAKAPNENKPEQKESTSQTANNNSDNNDENEEQDTTSTKNADTENRLPKPLNMRDFVDAMNPIHHIETNETTNNNVNETNNTKTK